jgi:hypothetical protein
VPGRGCRRWASVWGVEESEPLPPDEEDEDDEELPDELLEEPPPE